MMSFLFLIAALWIAVASSYIHHPVSNPLGNDLVDHRRGHHRSCIIPAMHDQLDGQSDRSRFLHRCCRSIAVSGLMPMLAAGLSLPSIGYASPPSVPPFPSRGFQTKSGLKVLYSIVIDYTESLSTYRRRILHRIDINSFNACSQYFDFNNVTEGPTPRYGQFVSLYYSMYYRPGGGTAQLELIDATEDKQPYLQKHGEARASADTRFAMRKLYCVCTHPSIDQVTVASSAG